MMEDGKVLDLAEELKKRKEAQEEAQRAKYIEEFPKKRNENIRKRYAHRPKFAEQIIQEKNYLLWFGNRSDEFYGNLLSENPPCFQLRRMKQMRKKTGEETSLEEFQQHITTCPECMEILERIRNELKNQQIKWWEEDKELFPRRSQKYLQRKIRKELGSLFFLGI